MATCGEVNLIKVAIKRTAGLKLKSLRFSNKVVLNTVDILLLAFL